MRFEGRKWDYLRKGMIFVMAAAMIWSLVGSMHLFDGGHIEEGSPVPSTELLLVAPDPGESTKRLTIGDFEGRGLLLNFFATWCGPCVEEMPMLQKLHEEHGGEDFLVVGVTDEPESTARAFMSQHGLSFPVLRDPGGRLAKRLEIRSIPHTVLVGPDGRVVDDVRGVVSASKAADMAEKLSEAASSYRARSRQ